MDDDQLAITEPAAYIKVRVESVDNATRLIAWGRINNSSPGGGRPGRLVIHDRTEEIPR